MPLNLLLTEIILKNKRSFGFDAFQINSSKFDCDLLLLSRIRFTFYYEEMKKVKITRFHRKADRDELMVIDRFLY